MGIDFDRIDRLVTEQHLDTSDINTILQEMCRKAMTQGVSGDFFGDTGFRSRLPDNGLHALLRVGSPTLTLDQVNLGIVFHVISFEGI